MTKPLTPIDPVLPPAPYFGGKKLLAARIIDRQRLVPHDLYAEPFIGMGGVFLRRPWRAHSEMINDISGDVATLFRILQRHYEAFVDMLRWQLTSREQFARLLALPPESLTDLERAARFLYLQRTGFGGKLRGRTFGTTRTAPSRFDVAKLAPMLEAVHARLSSVVIERLPWQEALRRYDRPGALFYLDPPYWGHEADYGAGVFSQADFTEMSDLLGRLEGAWLLSLNDTPDVRACFAAFDQQVVQTTYSAAGPGRSATRGKVSELLISKGVPRVVL